MSDCTETRPHALYRFWDRMDVLLYVGISVNLPTRLVDHRVEKPWWTEVVRVTVEHFDTRTEALTAEALAIKLEYPKYNVQHNNTGPVSTLRDKKGPSKLIIVCSSCRQRVIGKEKAVIHVPMRDVFAVEKAIREWDKIHPEGSMISLRELLSYPSRAQWKVTCNICAKGSDDPDCGTCYWFWVDRCCQLGQILAWSAHLAEKTWLKYTNWFDFTRMLASGQDGTGADSEW